MKTNNTQPFNLGKKKPPNYAIVERRGSCAGGLIIMNNCHCKQILQEATWTNDDVDRRLLKGAFAAVLVILALCQAANDDANPKPNERISRL